MTQPQKSMDGFVPRRSGTPLNRYQELSSTHTKTLRDSSRPGLERTPLRTTEPVLPKTDVGTLERSHDLGGLTRTDIDESLRELDENPPVEKKRSKGLARFRPRSIRKLLKRLAILIVIIGVAIGGWLGYKTFVNVNSVFKGGIFGLTQRQPLKQDANGRSNVLIFGTSEDSPDHNAGNGAGGPLLTDSIMVLSVNQEKKDAFMVSIPRDLWIKFDEPCSVGFQEKINSVYQCGSDFGENPEAGAQALMKKVGEVLGLDIQYYGQIDYSVVTRAVDAVGGVDVTIESNPPGMGILDRNFDWKCNYQCYYVKYEDGETVHLDGEHALALARARNAQGGYGLAAGNFDREKNQQKILRALREKALSLGTLTNIGAVTELLDAMGDNLKTNVEKSEIQTIISLATEIPSESIVSLDLYDEENPLVKTGPVNGASAVIPVAGMFDYSKIRSFIAKASTMDAAAKEGAVIAVLNGSGVTGAAQREADWLEEQGFDIGQIDNAPEGEYVSTKIYQRGDGMPATKKKLEDLYSTTIDGPPPVPINGEIDFLIIIGENASPR